MLPDVGGTELLVIAAVALIVVGPKDLPVLLRKLGQWMAKLRGMAADFRASFDEMARQSELDELRKEVEAMRSGQYHPPGASSDDNHIHQTFADIEAGLSESGASFYPPSAHAPPSVAPEPFVPESMGLEPETPAKPPRKPRARKPKLEAAEAAVDPLAEPTSVAPAPKPRTRAAKKTTA